MQEQTKLIEEKTKINEDKEKLIKEVQQLVEEKEKLIREVQQLVDDKAKLIQEKEKAVDKEKERLELDGKYKCLKEELAEMKKKIDTDQKHSRVTGMKMISQYLWGYSSLAIMLPMLFLIGKYSYKK
ncbi:unnamed protein product [Rotaria sp. Silwood2]|nr:unnamed protein product [Rotaria sp. Silwood2]CAF4392765.1 unnamed protein product [Rotaria sp. Silwood2]